MTITVVDVETSFVTGENGKTDPSPFNSRNKLVSVGINNEYLFFNHDERQDNNAFIKVQNIVTILKLILVIVLICLFITIVMTLE